MLSFSLHGMRRAQGDFWIKQFMISPLLVLYKVLVMVFRMGYCSYVKVFVSPNGWSSSRQWSRLSTVECFRFAITSSERDMDRSSRWHGWKSLVSNKFTLAWCMYEFWNFYQIYPSVTPLYIWSFSFSLMLPSVYTPILNRLKAIEINGYYKVYKTCVFCFEVQCGAPASPRKICSMAVKICDLVHL